MTNNRRVELQAFDLYDGTRVNRIIGTERRRFIGIFPYKRVHVAHTARQHDVQKLCRSFMNLGYFEPPDNEDGAHRALFVERTGGILAICNCYDYRHFVPFDRRDDCGHALRKALNSHIAHADRHKAVRQPALRVVQ